MASELELTWQPVSTLHVCLLLFGVSVLVLVSTYLRKSEGETGIAMASEGPKASGSRAEQYEQVIERIKSLLEGEDDWQSGMATVACELHHSFDHFHWTGFYRAAREQLLLVGPYQGGHGCLRIQFSRGVCGAAARDKTTQLVPDVHAFPGHIACASSTQSEIVVPVLTPDNRLLAVLDVDSDDPDAFKEVDKAGLERLCSLLGDQFKNTTHL